MSKLFPKSAYLMVFKFVRSMDFTTAQLMGRRNGVDFINSGRCWVRCCRRFVYPGRQGQKQCAALARRWTSLGKITCLGKPDPQTRFPVFSADWAKGNHARLNETCAQPPRPPNSPHAARLAPAIAQYNLHAGIPDNPGANSKTIPMDWMDWWNRNHCGMGT